MTVRIACEGREGEPWVTVSVTDEGIGIPGAERERVFDRCYRAENAAHPIPGTGLGLSGVTLIVEGHGGTVDLERTEREGSTFTMLAPARSAVVR